MVELVHYHKYNVDGNEVKLFPYAPGDAMGAISYASKKPYLYSVRATLDEGASSVRATSDEGASVWDINAASLDIIFQGKKGTIHIFQVQLSRPSQFAGYLKYCVEHGIVTDY